jgi:hypothetical protein
MRIHSKTSSILFFHLSPMSMIVPDEAESGIAKKSEKPLDTPLWSTVE